METPGICLASITPRMRILVVNDSDEGGGDNVDVENDADVLVVTLRVWMMMLRM